MDLLITSLGLIFVSPIIYNIWKRKYNKCKANDKNENNCQLIKNNIYSEETYISTSNENNFCAICTEPFKNNDIIIRFPCKHYFHKLENNQPSIFDWIKNNNRCPICNIEIDIIN